MRTRIAVLTAELYPLVAIGDTIQIVEAAHVMPGCRPHDIWLQTGLWEVAKWSGITQTLFVLEQGDPFRMMATLNGVKVAMPAVVPESLPAWLSP
jgi:hypothetical protein